MAWERSLEAEEEVRESFCRFREGGSELRSGILSGFLPIPKLKAENPCAKGDLLHRFLDASGAWDYEVADLACQLWSLPRLCRGQEVQDPFGAASWTAQAGCVAGLWQGRYAVGGTEALAVDVGAEETTIRVTALPEDLEPRAAALLRSVQGQRWNDQLAELFCDARRGAVWRYEVLDRASGLRRGRVFSIYPIQSIQYVLASV